MGARQFGARVKRLAATPDGLSIEWQDGGSSEFASLWLRDNVREDRDPHNGQRLVDVADLPQSPRIRSATLVDGAVRIAWEGEAREAAFGLDWLCAYAGGGACAAGQPRRWLVCPVHRTQP